MASTNDWWVNSPPKAKAAVEEKPPLQAPPRRPPAYFPGMVLRNREQPLPPPESASRIVPLPPAAAPAVERQTMSNVPGNQFLGGAGTAIATGALSALAQRYMGTGSTATNSFVATAEPTRAQLGAPVPRKRRRRRKLLTCSDKSDIAFLHGQLGGGALGRAAISSLLSRRC